MPSAPLVVLSCGEASGDLYGSRIARALLRRRPDLRLAGIAGPLCREEGVEPWAAQESLAVMGFGEVVRQLPRLWQLGREISARTQREGAALFLPVDYPGFHVGVAGRLKKHGVPVLDFIPPKTWSWGAHRLGKLARSVDRAAVIFRFEEAHYREAGIETDWVGHPLVDLHEEALDAVPPAREGILIAPGSRRQELARLVPALADAVGRIRAERPSLPVRVSRGPGVQRAWLAALEDAGVEVVDGPLFPELRRAQAAVICSGTATVEAALAGVAHLIVYRTGALTYALARRLARVGHIGMANLVLGRGAFPELVQGELSGRSVHDGLIPLLDPASPQARDQARACAELREALGPPGCFDRVAAIAVGMLGHRGR